MLGVNKSELPVGGARELEKNESLEDYLKDGLKDPQTARGKAASKFDASVPMSVSMISENVKPKEVLETFAERLANSKHFKEQTQYRQQVQAKMNSEIEQLFKKEFQDKSADSVVLSATSATYKKDEIKRSVDSSDDLKEPQVFSEDDTVLERVEKRLAARATESGIEKQESVSNTFSLRNPKLNESRVQETLKQFVAALSEDLIQQTPGKKREVSDIRERLQALGVSTKRINETAEKVSAFVSRDFKDNIKKGFTKFALSYSKKLTPELLASSKQYKFLEELGLESGILHDKSELKELKDQAKREMRSFVADQLDQTLIVKKAEGAPFKELVTAFNQFNELASVVKFDPGSYMQELGKKMDNLGLNYFVPPEPSRGFMDTDSQSGGRRGQSPPVELDGDGLGMADELRRLVIQRVIRTDIIGAIETRYKISRLRGKLKKSQGISALELAEIEQEGEALAKIKLIDMVRESLEERSALTALEGPGYDIVRSKMKKALKGLRGLNASIPKEEFNAMRDQINRNMFSVVKEEFLKLDVLLLQSPGNKSVAQKRKQLVSILQRLRKESSIAEEIESGQTRRISTPSDGTIVEAA